MVDLQRKLNKAIKTKVGKSIQSGVNKEFKVVHELLNLSSSEFSLIPLQIVADKGKGIASKDDQIKQLMPLLEQGGLAPKLLNLQQFSISGKKMTLEEAKALRNKIKRLKFLKVEKEKYEKRLKVLTPEELEAYATRLAAYEAKRAKTLEEYNYYITFKADPLPITKISYRVNNSTKEASMRIIKDNQPLNLIVYDIFVLKMLGFSKWLKVHAMDSKKTQAGIPPPPQLIAFGLTTLEKKRKRNSELIKEVFMKENIVVDWMHMNLAPPPRVVPSEGQVISEPELGIFFYNGNFDLVFQRENEFHLAITPLLIRIQNAIKVD
ncbi:hypothetical protein Tco_0918905 [Tanacetum coccineum]